MSGRSPAGQAQIRDQFEQAAIAAALMVFYVTEMKADSAVITVNYLGVEYTVSVERRNIEVPNGQNFKNN